MLTSERTDSQFKHSRSLQSHSPSQIHQLFGCFPKFKHLSVFAGSLLNRDKVKAVFLFPLFPRSGQGRTDEWSSAVAAADEGEDVWRPVVRPGEVTVTDVTLNSLTVTFRESRVAKGFFRDWGLEV